MSLVLQLEKLGLGTYICVGALMKTQLDQPVRRVRGWELNVKVGISQDDTSVLWVGCLKQLERQWDLGLAKRPVRVCP